MISTHEHALCAYFGFGADHTIGPDMGGRIHGGRGINRRMGVNAWCEFLGGSKEREDPSHCNPKGLVLGGSTAVLKGPNVLPYLATVGLFRLLMAGFGEPRLIRTLVPRSLRRQGLAEQDIQSMADAGLSIRVFGRAVAAIRDFDALKNLVAISAPILFINGDRDTNMVRGEPQFLAVAQQGRAHRFEKCGHGVSILRPVEFAALTNDFAAAVFGLSDFVHHGEASLDKARHGNHL